MTDKELLELAAKAAENGAQWDCPSRGMMVLSPNGNDTMTWNPLADDGDALRLAVKLNLEVSVWFVGGGVSCAVHGTDDDDDAWSFEMSDDQYADARRAIVRAAAEIGKETK